MIIQLPPCEGVISTARQSGQKQSAKDYIGSLMRPTKRYGPNDIFPASHKVERAWGENTPPYSVAWGKKRAHFFSEVKSAPIVVHAVKPVINITNFIGFTSLGRLPKPSALGCEEFSHSKSNSKQFGSSLFFASYFIYVDEKIKKMPLNYPHR